MSALQPGRALHLGLALSAGALALVFVLATGGGSGRPAAAQMPIVVEEVELVGGCQIKAFMPHYAPATPLAEIAGHIDGGNPRFWFMYQGPEPGQEPAPNALFDPASAERSLVDVLTDEAGFVCVDHATMWHRPLNPPPPCTYEPPYCLEPPPTVLPETPCPCAAPPQSTPGIVSY